MAVNPPEQDLIRHAELIAALLSAYRVRHNLTLFEMFVVVALANYHLTETMIDFPEEGSLT
jgi:hypothetical protein